MLICSQAWQMQVVSPSTNVCIWVEVQTWVLDCGVQTKTEALEWLEERWGQTQIPSQALNCATFCKNTSGSMLSLFFCCWSKKRNILNRGQEIPKLAAAIAEMISIHLFRRAVPCHHFSLEQALWSDHGLLSPAGPVSLLGPMSLSLDPLLCSIQSFSHHLLPSCVCLCTWIFQSYLPSPLGHACTCQLSSARRRSPGWTSAVSPVSLSAQVLLLVVDENSWVSPWQFRSKDRPAIIPSRHLRYNPACFGVYNRSVV